MTTNFRLAVESDGAALAEIYRPAVVGSSISFELDAPDAAEMGRRVLSVTARTPWLVCLRHGAMAGFAYASAHRDRAAYAWSVDVSAYVHPEHQRRGVGRALYASLFAVLVLQGFRNAYAGVALPNEASVRLHESVGFTPVGVYRAVGYKLGRWHDVAWYERELAPHVLEPPLPVTLGTLNGTETWQAALDQGRRRLRDG